MQRRDTKPDHLVDPNLLPPPPPKVKPKPQDVVVICTVCGTRMYAPLSKIGQGIQCPDCHSLCLVKSPDERKEQKPAGPTLDGAEDFSMSDPGERPRYRPLVAARGEYEILSALDPSSVTHGWKLPDGSTVVPGDEEEIQLSAPVERPEIKREPITLPPPDPEAALYDGRYDDDLIGENVDRRQPDAWKKSPFVIGIIEFLFQPGALSRTVIYSIGLALLLNLVHITVEGAAGSDPTWQFLAIFGSMFGMVGTGLWLAPFSACCFSIVQDTANGSKEVDSWPEWSIVDWIYPGLYFPIAGLISGLPGMLLTLALFSSGLDPHLAAFYLSVPLPLSWLVLFPIVLYSMLAENSLFGLLSKHTFRSFHVAGDGWVLFYMYSIVIFLFGAFAGSLALSAIVALRCVGAICLVPTIFLYARLIGRLMWYAAKQEAKFENQRTTEPASQ